MKKIIITHRKYIFNCTENEFLDFLKNTIGFSYYEYREPYKNNTFIFNGDLHLRERKVRFYHVGGTRTSINPDGFINYLIENDSIVANFNIELSRWSMYMPLILSLVSIIFASIVDTLSFGYIIVFPIFWGFYFFFQFIDYRFHRRLFLSDFERKLRNYGLPYSVEESYDNKYFLVHDKK
jgi:hypothetical protein